jgi:nucleoside-diphosphate-sugar epimerase
MARYLVTGAAGFIGSQVARVLLQSGHEVVGLDSFNEAYDPRLKRYRAGELARQAGFKLHEAELTDRRRLDAVFAEGGGRPRNHLPPFAGVLNLAARAGVRPSVEDPWAYVEANVTGTLNLLDACRRFGVGKFVLASTSSLYGAHNPVPYREDAGTDRPLSPYAASKKAAETMAYAYHHLHALDVSVLRYFTVYGPAGRPDMSVFRFIRRIAEGEPLVLYGDGGQERDFTYVDDIARGTVAALAPLGYEVINLGGDRPVKLVEIIERLEQLLGRAARIDRRPAHPADVPATWADITKARLLLGWSPQIPLEEGLARCVAWYQSEHALAQSIELFDRD